MSGPDRRAAPPIRADGYAPIRDYAALGDGRTVALVARDGAVDWLCLPALDSPTVFGALLDAERGGSFTLCPRAPFGVERAYRPGTNVLETVFRTAEGAVRVTDAMTLPGSGLGPARELARRVQGLSGRVELEWRVQPRFGYAAAGTLIGRRDGVPVATAGADAMAVQTWDASEHAHAGAAIGGEVVLEAGETALLALSTARQEPLVLSSRAQVEARLDDTASWWAGWAAGRQFAGPWRDAVVRSALALKLLVFAPSGAIAAAATASLPEELGGVRNWDYRFSWIRDSAFTLGALLELGCPVEARSYFWWLLHATQLTHPHAQVFYRLDGGADAPERTLALDGYGSSRPVRVGNGAAGQRQLDIHGDLLHTAWLYAERGGRLDAETGRRLAEVADLVCAIWRRPDAGIWEVRSEPAHFTHSKIMCWVALDRALALAAAGLLPDRHASRWRAERRAIRTFVERRCWSERHRSYVRAAGGEELDASLLLAVLLGYGADEQSRLAGTVDAVLRALADGPLLYRYSGEDGLTGGEGAFLCCSFWLVDALARLGRVEAAATLMDELLGLANDVGLYAEELDPRTGAFLGNFPQGLVHLALVNAAASVARAEGP